jgi:nicotinamidase-related amidase
MLDRNNTGLMLIDVQGKLAHLVDQSEALIQNCERLVQGANLLNLPVVWVEQEPDKLGATVPSIASHLSGLSPILKHSFNACRQPAVMEAIEQAGCEHWLVCGIEAHICVYQTVQHLVDLDYGIQLVTDAVASRSATNKQLAIQKLSAAGVELTSVEMALYELMQDCRIPEFKQILDLIK